MLEVVLAFALSLRSLVAVNLPPGWNVTTRRE